MCSISSNLFFINLRLIRLTYSYTQDCYYKGISKFIKIKGLQLFNAGVPRKDNQLLLCERIV